jgi:spore coat polysaccharide biosynthesis protein SpsF
VGRTVIGVFLQVRLDSSRLPRKALADLGGRTVTERCFNALGGVRADVRVLVTEPASAPELGALARNAGWELFVGSKDDVLDRFVQAARATGASCLVRATGDNPLVSAALANRLVERHLALGSDYSGFVGAPVGTGVEVLAVRALEQAWSSSADPYDREHVSPYLYRHPDLFAVDRPEVPEACRMPEGRVTIDTADDLDYVRSLWKETFRGAPPEAEDLISWLTRHPR